MQTIHKYPFEINDTVELHVPQCGRLLKIDAQRDQPCMWFLVDDQAPKQRCTFLVRGTGHDCTGVGQHLGTFQMHGGSLVFHVFES